MTEYVAFIVKNEISQQGRPNFFVVEVDNLYERHDFGKDNLLLCKPFRCRGVRLYTQYFNNAKGWLRKLYLWLSGITSNWWMPSSPSCYEGCKALGRGAPLQPSWHTMPPRAVTSLLFAGGACAAKDKNCQRCGNEHCMRQCFQVEKSTQYYQNIIYCQVKWIFSWVQSKTFLLEEVCDAMPFNCKCALQHLSVTGINTNTKCIRSCLFCAFHVCVS